MKTLPEKEVLFNRFYYGKMSKKELESLVARLHVDRELFEWFRF